MTNRYKTKLRLVRQDGENIDLQDEEFRSAREVLTLVASFLGENLPPQELSPAVQTDVLTLTQLDSTDRPHQSVPAVDK